MTHKSLKFENKIHGTKQGELTVSDYYSEYWLVIEGDILLLVSKQSTEDAVLFQELVEKQWVQDFLASLNQKYDQMRVQILVPSLEDAYSYVY